MNRRETLQLILAAGGALIAPLHGLASEQQDVRSSSEQIDSKMLPAEVFEWLPLGTVKPSGWIKAQMVRDLNHGFAGCLGKLCPEASSDIFVSHRNSIHAQNTQNSNGVAWWNGESEGNWRAGYIMMAYLTDDTASKREADEYVQHILSSQEADGYLGAFAPDSRFIHPGELWTQACLLRGLLAYSELTENREVLAAVQRSADLTISTFGTGKMPMPWGENHDLMISDVMERLFQLTGETRYRDFTLWLYQTWSENVASADTSLSSLLDRNTPYVQHGVHTYETIRVPLWLAYASGREDLGRASRNALEKLDRYTEPGGSAVSQELISNLAPDPTSTEYEYCATKEAQLTLQSALQKTGLASLGDRIERVWFNDAQGARTADGRAIAYLSPENRTRCDGFSPDGTRAEPRNKFSPTHADVAVCCNPNATNVAALFVRGMWMRHHTGALAALLYGPCEVSLHMNNVQVHIEERTLYPFTNMVEIHLNPDRPVTFSLLLRDPGWSRGTSVSAQRAEIVREGDYWRVTKQWKAGDTVILTFVPVVREVDAVNGEIALQHGALLFVRPIASTETIAKTYPLSGFQDTHYEPAPGASDDLMLPKELQWQGFGFQPVDLPSDANGITPLDAPIIALRGNMIRKRDRQRVSVDLVPLGNAPLLRRLTHPVGT